MNRTLFIDSWGWITLAKRQEERHETVKELYRLEAEAGCTFATSDYVLDETITFLFPKMDFNHRLYFHGRHARTEYRTNPHQRSPFPAS